MNTPTMVRSIHHAEHYAMSWDDFFLCTDMTVGDAIKSRMVSKDDDDKTYYGKFQSALDERIYDATMDGGYEECGQSEYDGHHVLVPFSTDDLIELGVIGLKGDFTYVPVGCIVTTMNSGAVDVSYYDTGAELDKAWNECLDEQNNYSTDIDAFLTFDHGKYTISSEGRSEGSYDDRREALFMMYYNMNNDGYWPNVWEINDHGNETQLFTNNKFIAGVLNDYVEFRDEEEAQAG